MKVEERETDSLIPYARNPRINDMAVDAVASSIKEFGFQQPIVVDSEGVIIVGHTRLKAAQKLGLKTVPVQVAADLTEDQIKAYRILDNRIGEKAEWDFELLSLELDSIQLDMSVFDVTFDDMLSETVRPEIVEDEAPEVQDDAITWPGDLWLLGDHRVLCGDSTKREDVERVMDGARASLVFTDPPYGVAIGAKNRRLNSFHPAGRNWTDIEDDALSPEDLKAKLVPAFTNIRQQVMADDCTVFVTAPQGGELGMMMMMMMQEAGLRVRHVLIWKKNQPTFSMGRLDYDYQHEPIFLTWGKRHKRPMKGDHRTSVWEIDRPRKSEEHPTMKPVALVANALLNNSETGDNVFDAYCGSGTTLIAAEQLNRRAFGIEIEPKYVDVIVRRWQKLTGKSATLDGTTKTFIDSSGALASQ